MLRWLRKLQRLKLSFSKGSTPATGSSSNKKDETKYDAYKKAGKCKGYAQREVRSIQKQGG